MTDPTPNSEAANQAPGSDITREHPVVALGGGPAGLTAGYLLAKQGKPVIVLESTDHVGGIARTDVREGYRFDLGGHRFFTKAKEVDDLWHEILADESLHRGMISLADHPVVGEYRVTGPGMILDATPLTVRRPAPLRSEHTAEVLAEVGYTAEEISALVAAGVAGLPKDG